jgi:hypothetical protein
MPTKNSKLRRHAVKKAIRGQRPIHKRALLHPITVFGLLCAGVFIAGLTYKAVAETINVNAKVVLTTGAVITSPMPNQTITGLPLTVQGSCQANSYVKLLRNGSFSGSAWCDNQTFTIQTDLSPGSSNLQAKAFSVTDDEGPATPAVEVTYNPPVSAKTKAAAYSEPPPILVSDYNFHSFQANNEFSWDVQIRDGLAPFHLLVDWGDNTTFNYFIKAQQTLTIRHTYKKAGYYTVNTKLTDARGRASFLQLAALISEPGANGFITPQTTKPSIIPPQDIALSLTSQISRWLWLIWPTYGIVTLMAISFWLGERQEYSQIRRRPRRHA